MMSWEEYVLSQQAGMDFFDPEKFIHPNPKTFDSYRRQFFSLPFGIISYITQTPTSANGLSKLQKSCKFFFAKNKILVINRNIYQNGPESFLKHIIYLKPYFEKFKHIKFWIKGTMKISDDYLLIKSGNIYGYCLQSLTIHKLDFTFKEINFILSYGTVKTLFFAYVNVYDENEDIVSCDRILKKVPKIQNFRYFCKNEIFTNETFQKMNALKFKTKFVNFVIAIYEILPDADTTLLCKFVKKNANNFSEFYFPMKMENPETYRTSLELAVKKIFQTWDIGVQSKVRVL